MYIYIYMCVCIRRKEIQVPGRWCDTLWAKKSLSPKSTLHYNSCNSAIRVGREIFFTDWTMQDTILYIPGAFTRRTPVPDSSVSSVSLPWRYPTVLGGPYKTLTLTRGTYDPSVEVQYPLWRVKGLWITRISYTTGSVSSVRYLHTGTDSPVRSVRKVVPFRRDPKICTEYNRGR